MKVRRARPGSSRARRTNSRPVNTRPRFRRAGLDIRHFARSHTHAGCGLPPHRYRSLNSSVPPQGQGRISPLAGRSAARRSCDTRRVLAPMWAPRGFGCRAGLYAIRAQPQLLHSVVWSGDEPAIAGKAGLVKGQLVRDTTGHVPRDKGTGQHPPLGVSVPCPLSSGGMKFSKSQLRRWRRRIPQGVGRSNFANPTCRKPALGRVATKRVDLMKTLEPEGDATAAGRTGI